MNVLFILVIFFNILSIINLQKLCGEKDIKKIYSPCNENNFRTILHSKVNECLIEQNNTNLIYPKIEYGKCDLKCEKGSVYNFDILTNKSQCIKCTDNSISSGSTFNINGKYQQWNKNFTKIKGFKTYCFLSSDSNEIPAENKDCEGFSVNEDNSLIVSGYTNKTQVQYIGLLIYGFNMKNSGEIKFTYKKDSIKDDYFNNGQFIAFIDYKIIVKEADLNSAKKTFKMNLPKGDHHVIFVYDYFNNVFNSKSQELRLKIESLEISGIEDSDLECKNCEDGLSIQGQCFHCNFNFYLDNQCKLCPENKFSFPNSIGADSCIKKQKCDEFDYTINSVSNCENGVRRISKILTQPSFCDMTENKSEYFEDEPCDPQTECILGYSYINGECQKCNLNQYSNFDTNFKCQSCSLGKIPSNVYNITNLDLSKNEFENHCTSKNFEFCNQYKGWQFKRDKIYTGKYFPLKTEVTFELSKTIKVLNFVSSISFDLHLINISEQEYFEIKINDKIVKNFTDIYGDINKNININLDNGINIVTWTYHRTKNSKLKNDNIISISNILIRGSILGGYGECTSCPDGTVIDTTNLKTVCTPCIEGFTPNILKTKCEKCPFNTISDENRQCQKCPIFTSTLINNNTNFCNLDTIIKIEEKKLRFDLNPLIMMIKLNCLSKQNIICYNEKFIGPIRDKSNKRDLFFVSLFEPDKIKLEDFSFERSNNDQMTGHIFGLFDKARVKIKHSDISYINSNIQNQNIKVLKNIASSVKKVSIVYDRNEDIKNGIMIEMNEGDVCLKDPKRRYKSYVFLECNKEMGMKSPTLIKKIDNECTYLFKWNSDYACRNCLKEELKVDLTPCKNNKQTAVYQDSPSCRIFVPFEDNKFYNLTNIKYDDSVMFDLRSEILNEFQINQRILQTSFISENSNNRPSPYAEIIHEVRDCTLLEGLDETSLYIIFAIPIIFVVTVFIFLCIFFKYRKVKKDYERLALSETQSSKDKITDQKLEI